MVQIKRKYAAIGGTVACVLAIGFVMQAPSPVSTRSSMTQTETVAQTATAVETLAAAAKDSEITVTEIEVQADPESQKAPLEAGVADIPLAEIALTAAAPVPNVPRVLPPLPKPQRASLRRDAVASADALPKTPFDPETPSLGCNVLAQASETLAATALLTVAAPCYPNERLTVHHNGLMFTEITDAAGNLSVDVPALSEHAIFIVAFANGKGAVAQAHVASIGEYDRVALQWSDTSGFQVHAREFGAGYGDKGHVWSGSARTGVDADRGTGGFVTRLGNPDTLSPQLAEVYSFPSGHAANSGTVKMSIEAEVTEANCGRDVSAQMLELHAGGGMQIRDLVLSVPDCDAVGDFLVLNNLLDDLKVAGK